jgi:predicted RNA-binding protein associated with RNAse of E/G family
MKETYEVVKLNLAREASWRYNGQLLQRQANGVLLEAFFNRPDLPFHGIVFGEGDRFLEAYWSDRWYNIFEIHDRRDDALKGWYCNVSRPAEILPGTIRFVDLALDLLIHPDGRQLVLDEDEFQAMALDEVTRMQAQAALGQLQAVFAGAGGAGFSVTEFFKVSPKN